MKPMNARQSADVVAIAMSRAHNNQCAQGRKRTMVGNGHSDCSSFVRWCYLQALGLDIGNNTVAQFCNRSLSVVDASAGKPPAEDRLLPGDLMFFRGADAARPCRVGHVEMYIGGGKLIGHGGGIGPTVKIMSSYCAARKLGGRGYLRTMRVCPDGPNPPRAAYHVMIAPRAKEVSET